MSWWFGALELDRRVSPGDPKEVTSREGGQPEADPLVAGMTPQDIEFIWRAVEALYDTGLHPAIALCVQHMSSCQRIMSLNINWLHGLPPVAPCLAMAACNCA